MEKYSAYGRYITEKEANEIIQNAPRGYEWKLKATTKTACFYQFQKVTKTRTIVLLNMEVSK